jgi:hypothetical protein
MKEIDWENLEWALSQRDLKLNYIFLPTVTGNEHLDKALVKVSFFWKRGDQTEWSLALMRYELMAVILELQSKDLEVPKEFHEALQEWEI